MERGTAQIYIYKYIGNTKPPDHHRAAARRHLRIEICSIIVAATKRGHDGKQKRAGETPYTEWENVCAFCDDGGGYLLCCDGVCLRSFHPTKEHGKNSGCTSLDLTEEYQWNAEKYTCENCRRKQHQCFACGLLGSPDSSSSVPRVFQCKDQNCGHFYHPKCVADLLYPDRETIAVDFQQNVADGLQFHFPMHRCRACNGAENKDDKKMQFALCRRCPTAYHRMCLPSKIGFKASKKEGTPQRAWDDVLTDRVLIYCTKHGIDRELLTPKRDHIVFPEDTSPRNS